MKSISKLKDEARKHEQREAWESAIHAYLQVLAAGEEGESELEISLYNRVGDLFVRLNRSRDAVQYYEQAADRYADAGLFNNAIALCNKALRYMPDRAELLHKLGQYSAGQGFHTDARRYYLEYAEKQFASGGIDLALRALEELAQVEDSAELRELMGHRLHAGGRVAEGLTQLRRAYELRLDAGEAERAEALRREIALIDPNAFEGSPTPAEGQARLDARASAIAPVEMDTSLTEPEGAPEPEPAFGDDLELEPAAPEPGETPAGPAGVIDGFESGTFEGLSGMEGPAPLSGLEIDTFEDQPEAKVEVSDLERPEALAGDDVAPEPVPGLETGAAAEAPPSGLDSLSFDLALIHYTEEPEAPESEPTEPLPLMEDEPEAVGELPLLEDEGETLPLPLLEGDEPRSETSAFPPRDDADAEPLAAGAGELPAIEEPEELVSEPGWNFPSLTTGPPQERPPEPAFERFEGKLDDVLESALERVAEEERRRDAPAPEPPERPDPPDRFGMSEPGKATPREASPAELPPLPPLTPLTGRYEPAPAPARPPQAEEPVVPAADAVAEAHAEPEKDATSPVLPSLLSRAAAGMRAAFERLEGAGGADPTGAGEGESDPRQATATPADAGPAREPAAPEPAFGERDLERREPEPEMREPDPELRGTEPEPRESDPGFRESEPEFREPEPAVFLARSAPEAAPGSREAAARAEAGQELSQEPEETTVAPKATGPESGPEPPKEYMDLASFLVDPEPEADTRFVVQEKAPTGDEDQDFAELLSQFKQKVAENVSVEDAAAHYDLGLAFKEMGLIEEAIGEFQVALRAGDMRLKVYEELGQCFLLRGQYNIAEKVLRRALESPFDDELELLGVYYHLGRACEELGKREAARDAYERVLGIDINFADVSARLARL